MPFGSDTQSRSASSTAARNVLSPLVTGTTVAPSSFMRPTFGAWRSMSTDPMYTVQGMPSRAQAAADATPCWPAPVSAITRFAPSFFASSTWPMELLILCAPVCARSSRFSQTSAPHRFDSVRAYVSGVGRPTQSCSSAWNSREKLRIAQVAIDAGLQAIERRHQRLRHVAAAEGTEAAALVGIGVLAACWRAAPAFTRLRTCFIDLLRCCRACVRTNS